MTANQPLGSAESRQVEGHPSTKRGLTFGVECIHCGHQQAWCFFGHNKCEGCGVVWPVWVA